MNTTPGFSSANLSMSFWSSEWPPCLYLLISNLINLSAVTLSPILSSHFPASGFQRDSPLQSMPFGEPHLYPIELQILMLFNLDGALVLR